jgi:hypothetical protein
MAISPINANIANLAHAPVRELYDLTPAQWIIIDWLRDNLPDLYYYLSVTSATRPSDTYGRHRTGHALDLNCKLYPRNVYGAFYWAMIKGWPGGLLIGSPVQRIGSRVLTRDEQAAIHLHIDARHLNGDTRFYGIELSKLSSLEYPSHYPPWRDSRDYWTSYTIREYARRAASPSGMTPAEYFLRAGIVNLVDVAQGAGDAIASGAGAVVDAAAAGWDTVRNVAVFGAMAFVFFKLSATKKE